MQRKTHFEKKNSLSSIVGKKIFLALFFGLLIARYYADYTYKACVPREKVYFRAIQSIQASALSRIHKIYICTGRLLHFRIQSKVKNVTKRFWKSLAKVTVRSRTTYFRKMTRKKIKTYTSLINSRSGKFAD